LEPLTPKPIERHGIRRGIYILPSLFTVGTLVCGYYAILSTQRAGQFLAGAAAATLASKAAELSALAASALDNASKAIGWAIVADGLDGRIARLTNTASPFGREFDSLADVVTFGVAPAVLAYVWGVRAVVEPSGSTPQVTQIIHAIPWILTFLYVICGAARLARFNIDTVKPTSDRRFFVGMPIPAGAGFVAAFVHFYKAPITTWHLSAAWLGIVGILGFLMVSRMRYYSFKTLDLRKRQSYLIIVLIGLVIGGIWFFSESVLMVIAVTYAISGIVLRVISKIRPHPPTPEEVQAT
jgi:CDP-diacylglycerol---serine O-phosphatidyltransferase